MTLSCYFAQVIGKRKFQYKAEQNTFYWSFPQICGSADQFVKASQCLNTHGHMVLWWEQNADSLRVIFPVEEMLPYNESWTQWDGQHWHREAEAPVGSRGSHSLRSVWVLFCTVIQKKKINTRRCLRSAGDADTSPGCREAWATLTTAFLLSFHC